MGKLKDAAIRKTMGAGLGELPKLLKGLNEVLGSMHAYMERIDEKLDKTNQLLTEIRDKDDVDLDDV